MIDEHSDRMIDDESSSSATVITASHRGSFTDQSPEFVQEANSSPLADRNMAIYPLYDDKHQTSPSARPPMAGDAAQSLLLLSGGTSPPALADSIDFHYSPELMTDDGIFLPGSMYQEFHKALRNSMFHTARSVPATRHQSPERPLEGAPGSWSNLPPQSPQIAPVSLLPDSDGPRTPPELTQEQEYVLWKNWIEEISAWLDKFDHHKHFRHTLPAMAKTTPHLRYSILALSARHLERKDGSLPAEVSLSLYQEAIHLLLSNLHTKDITVIASCVVLCVLEMFSCSPKAWRRHLDGCASLIQAMNIRGDKGGVEQSLFWCFARMDVCGALISSERTLIPIDKWTSNSTFEEDIAMYRSSFVFEEQANYILYLLARLLDLFACCGLSLETGGCVGKPPHGISYRESWSMLFKCMEEWYQDRPEEMKAVFTSGADLAFGSHPFPTVLFGNGAAISGNQLYHTAALLSIQKKPHGISKPERSILWHARQICAISLSNNHHGCWTNCVQPLWIAGQVMSHPSEHKAILEIYSRIEKETGWGARWRADDLKEYWGASDE